MLVTPTSLTPNLDSSVQSVSKLQDAGGTRQPGPSWLLLGDLTFPILVGGRPEALRRKEA